MFSHKDWTTEKYIEKFGEFRINKIKINQKELKKLNSSKQIICKICNAIEDVSSFRAHIRWKHPEYSSDSYVEKFGEFRPKKLERQAREHTMECKICNIKLLHNRHLMFHINKFHPEITKEDYIIKYIYKNNAPLCKCGCGGKVTILENGRNCDLDKETYSRDYIKGHIDWEVFKNIGKQSKEEIELVEFLKTIYFKEIRTNVREIIPKGEIDIYLPDINLGIEYNGLYWHSEKGGRLKNYHLDKLKKAQSKNIRLIQIFSDEWLNKKTIVKEKLKSILTEKSSKIYARKCKVYEIEAKNKNIFLNENHIQGEDRSQIKLGISYEDKLVGVMTFSKPRISLGGKQNTKDIYELSRYASKIYIVGGAAKLIKYFENKYKPKCIYSYSDNRWTDSNKNMYIQLGFKFEKQSEPNYFYTKNFLTRIHRYNFNKYALKKLGADVENKTEFEIMEDMGYTRVWDCGSTKYILEF